MSISRFHLAVRSDLMMEPTLICPSPQLKVFSPKGLHTHDCAVGIPFGKSNDRQTRILTAFYLHRLGESVIRGIPTKLPFEVVDSCRVIDGEQFDLQHSCEVAEDIEPNLSGHRSVMRSARHKPRSRGSLEVG